MLNTQRSPSRSPPPEVQQALGFLLAAAHFDSIDPKTLSEFMQAFVGSLILICCHAY
jgi:hypothetical protein